MHPVHFMDTLAQGISASLANNNNSQMPLNEMRLMFQGGYVYIVTVLPMIEYSKKLAHWVTAEIISAGNAKVSMQYACATPK